MTRAVMGRPTGVTGPPPLEAPWLRQGPLFRSGGVAVYDGLIGRQIFAALCAEAQANYASADRQVCDVLTSDNCDWRGGVPPRQLSTAGGGPVQDEFYRSPHLRSFLSEVCGGPVRPSGSRGSYSYYVAPADHLGLHLDILTCDVTVINVLTDSAPDTGGSLAVQPGSVGVPLSVLRRWRISTSRLSKHLPGPPSLSLEVLSLTACCRLPQDSGSSPPCASKPLRDRSAFLQDSPPALICRPRRVRQLDRQPALRYATR